jgi:hypothetical protein
MYAFSEQQNYQVDLCHSGIILQLAVVFKTFEDEKGTDRARIVWNQSRLDLSKAAQVLNPTAPLFPKRMLVKALSNLVSIDSALNQH